MLTSKSATKIKKNTILLFCLEIFFVGFLSFKAIAAEYVAFSMKVAKERIVSIPKGSDFRNLYPEVFTLGGITVVRGLVYDRKTEDVILVGERVAERAILTLDDFVVALRARFIHGEWPLVSIDPTPETEKTNNQIVRFEGGIENTQFGQDLFDADYKLKKIGMGILSPGVPDFKTEWDLGLKRAKQKTSKNLNIRSRFWFYPILPSVAVREDVVSIKGLKVGVFTEVLSAEIDGKKIEDLSNFQDAAGDEYASQVSRRFEELSLVHPSFSRLHGLDELVALTRAIEEMENRPDLSFWLKTYRVKQVKTKKNLDVLKREEKFELPTGSLVYRVSGGVELMAIALRFKAGDVTALKEAVLKTRPEIGTLMWGFIIGEWLIPTSGHGLSSAEDVVTLFSHAQFLKEQKRYDDAIVLYDKIIKLEPGWDWPYHSRGVAYGLKGQYDRAIPDYNKAIGINSRYTDLAIKDFTSAIQINPDNAAAYSNLGAALNEGKKDYELSIIYLNKAIKINPNLFGAYLNRGVAHMSRLDFDAAIADFYFAASIDDSNPLIYLNSGIAYRDCKDDFDTAIKMFTLALEKKYQYAEAYVERGITYYAKGDYTTALQDFTTALSINPEFAEAISFRGLVYYRQEENARALNDLDRAISLRPDLPELYNNRGIINHAKGNFEQSIVDYNMAIEIDQKNTRAFLNRSKAYYIMGEFSGALRDLTKVIELRPDIIWTYNRRGNIYLELGDHDKAFEDLTRAIFLEPDNPDYYYDRALAFGEGTNNYEKAISDCSRAIEIDSHYARAYWYRGKILISKFGKVENGCSDLRTACVLGLCDVYRIAKKKYGCK